LFPGIERISNPSGVAHAAKSPSNSPAAMIRNDRSISVFPLFKNRAKIEASETSSAPWRVPLTFSLPFNLVGPPPQSLKIKFLDCAGILEAGPDFTRLW
jgi:hypothetical protein